MPQVLTDAEQEGGLKDDMAEDSLRALYEQLYRTLAGANVIWGNRVFPDLVEAKAPRPHVLISYVSGGELNLIHNQDHEYTIQVKCIAGGDRENEEGQTMATAMSGAAAISALLNDKGTQDRNDGTGIIPGDDDWQITTITQDIRVHLVDPFKEATPIYHDGHQFVIRMQRK